jgi:hypothetical protein
MLIYPLRVSRSSNDDVFGSLDDQDRFYIKAHSGHLESKAQSLQKDADDTNRQEHPNVSKAPKKANPKKDIILVTSSGGPPKSNRHVSTPTFSI